MEPDTSPQEVGQRIEQLLAELAEGAVPETTRLAEELVRQLMGMYGAGLERIVTLLAGSAEAGALLAELAEDELVSSLLVLHDLHPEDTEARVVRALETVRPYLGSHAGGVQLLGVDVHDPAAAVVALRLEGSCDGCPSSALTVRMAIEKAIEQACPEVVRVDVEGLADASPGGAKELPLLQIQPGPPPADVPASWVALTEPGLRPGQCATLAVTGHPVLLALPSSPGGLVAYVNGCAACNHELDGATLAGDQLSCPSCTARFDVRRAGRAAAGSRHLTPLPLITTAGELRVAVPRATVGVAS